MSRGLIRGGAPGVRRPLQHISVYTRKALFTLTRKRCRFRFKRVKRFAWKIVVEGDVRYDGCTVKPVYLEPGWFIFIAFVEPIFSTK